ncbi:MAG: hypothetical protein JWO32_3172 [Bacteroidetes bacterium]|nr:hypothetical protein [Bacteroidota bacterium]
MKDVYLVHITLPDFFTKPYYALVPAQRDVINALLKKRVIRGYSQDMDRKNIWCFIEAISEQEVMDILSTFPIISHVKVNITELAFFDTTPAILPDLIMN